MEEIAKNDGKPEAEKEMLSWAKKILHKLKTLKFIIKLIKKEGVMSLFNGLSASIVATTVAYFVYFLAYKFFTNMVKNNFKLSLTAESLIASTLAGTCGTVTANPIFVLYSRMAKAKTSVYY